MGKICSVDDSISQDPAAYVVEMRQVALRRMLNQRVEIDNEDEEAEIEGMNNAEIREYYDRKVKKKLAKMDPLEQQAMFKRYNVSAQYYQR